jgi:hypothetical protein
MFTVSHSLYIRVEKQARRVKDTANNTVKLKNYPVPSVETVRF